MKTFFLLKKKHFFHHFFQLFQLFFWSKFSDFSPENLISRAEKTFLRNNTIWYPFHSKFATLIDFEKKSSFFLKKPINFSLKYPKFWTFWKFLLFQSHSTAFCIWYCLVMKNLAGQLASKYQKQHHFEWMVFLPYYIWAENNKLRTHWKSWKYSSARQFARASWMRVPLMETMALR